LTVSGLRCAVKAIEMVFTQKCIARRAQRTLVLWCLAYSREWAPLCRALRSFAVNTLPYILDMVYAFNTLSYLTPSFAILGSMVLFGWARSRCSAPTFHLMNMYQRVVETSDSHLKPSATARPCNSQRIFARQMYFSSIRIQIYFG